MNKIIDDSGPRTLDSDAPIKTVTPPASNDADDQPTLRDQFAMMFAGQALATLPHDVPLDRAEIFARHVETSIPQIAYRFADGMLKARGNGK